MNNWKNCIRTDGRTDRQTDGGQSNIPLPQLRCDGGQLGTTATLLANGSLWILWIRPVQSTTFKVLLSYFLFRPVLKANFIECLCFFICLVAQNGQLERSMANMHWPPMNKFACKLHGYIVYIYTKFLGKIIFIKTCLQKQTFQIINGGPLLAVWTVNEATWSWREPIGQYHDVKAGLGLTHTTFDLSDLWILVTSHTDIQIVMHESAPCIDTGGLKNDTLNLVDKVRHC